MMVISSGQCVSVVSLFIGSVLLLPIINTGYWPLTRDSSRVNTVLISGLEPDSPQPQPWQSKIVAGNKDDELYSQQLFYSARAGAGGCLDQDQILILYILLRTFRISQTHDALSACIPGDGVDQHGGGWQGGADEGGAAAQLRGQGHDPHEHRTQGRAHMEHGGVVWWLQIKYDNKNK